MNVKLAMETVSFVLLLVAFPVISSGTTDAVEWVWVLGLLLLVAAGLLPILTRFMDHADAPRDMGMELDERVS